MTAKRFEINNEMTLDNKVETYELSCIVDNSNKTFYFVVDSIANVESFVERLNELVDENEQLKSFNQDLSENLSVCADKRLSQGEYLTELQLRCNDYDKSLKILQDFTDRKLKENEQLKKRNKKRLQRLKNQRKELKKQQEVIWGYKGDIKQLKQENEQLKCGNKNLKAILNDFINICNRLQSNPNNEQTLNVARDMLQNMGRELEE